MARRSLRASPEGMIRAKQVFESKGLTQEDLANEVGLSSRQSVWKFFTGRPIERQYFKEICQRLDLVWEEIVELSPEKSTPLPVVEVDDNLGIAGWVQVMRTGLFELIQTQCNTLQSPFEVTQPLLSQVYTVTQVLSQPSYQRWLEVSDLQESHNTSERFSLSQTNFEAVSGLEIVSQQEKLIILGKPGAGKTTFLQYIALQCNQGKFRQDLVPFFVQLRTLFTEIADGEELTLQNYLINQCRRGGLSRQQGLSLLQEGRGLLLLDGLDEIPLEKSNQILKDIDSFTQEFYKNPIIITCRSAAIPFHFRGFTYVEITDFNSEQIAIFAQKWFLATASSSAEGRKKAQQFLDQLKRTENQPIRELAVTPILLSLLCSVFQERMSFPSKRAKLYQAALDILLKRWDRARGIQRDRVYQHLSLPDKIKLLCQIAATTFEQGCYFFETSDVLHIIEEYLRHLPNLSSDVETLLLTSEAVLKAIELQHGLLVERARDIYSFSHLTFQEYLTARKVIANPSGLIENELIKLAEKMLDIRWREVILLTASMLPKADPLLRNLLKIIQRLVSKDSALYQHLASLNRKVLSLKLAYKEAAIRAFYFTLFNQRDLNLSIALDVKFASMRNLVQELDLDATLARALRDSLYLTENPDLKDFLNLCFTLDLESRFKLTADFQKAIRALKSQLPNLDINRAEIENWWRTQGQQWCDRFRQILIEYRQIGWDWQLDHQQQASWQQYYQANLFLVECLNSDCQITQTVREEIEAQILLPPPSLN